MGKFPKADEEALRILEELAAGATCERRKMFGCPTLLINGNMFSGVFGTRLFFKIPPDSHAAWKKKVPTLKVFEPVPGRVSKGSLEIEAGHVGLETLRSLFEAAADHARALPAKPPKPRKRV